MRRPHAKPEAPAGNVAPTTPAPETHAEPPPPLPSVGELLARIDELKAQLAAQKPSPVDPTVTRRAYLHHTSIRFRNKDFVPVAGQDIPFPFDPQNPPEDVSGYFVEGVDYVYR